MDEEGVRTKLSFEANIAEVSLSYLLELMVILASYKDGLVVVGGWVPYLLLKEFKNKEEVFEHIGSKDIDIVVDPRVIDEKRYASIVELLQEKGYALKEGTRFSYVKTVTTTHGKDQIQVDFLAPEYGGTAKGHRHQVIQGDFNARKARGADIAIDHKREFKLEGKLPNGAVITASFFIADIIAIMTMKGIVLGSRYKEKDAYDIYSLVRYYKTGPKAVAEEIKPLLENGLVKESLDSIKEHFKTKESVGPAYVADFLRQTGDTRERTITEVFEYVQRFLLALYESPQSSGKPEANASGDIPVLDIEPNSGGQGGSAGHFMYFQAINTGEKVAIDCHWGIRGFAYEWRSPNTFVLSPGEKRKLEYKFDGEKPYQQIVPELNIFFEYKDNKGVSYFTRRELVQEKTASFYDISKNKVGDFHPAVVLEDLKIRNISDPYSPQGNFGKEVVVDVEVDSEIKKVKIGIGLLNNMFQFSEEELKAAFSELVQRKVKKMIQEGNVKDYTFTEEDLPKSLQQRHNLTGFEVFKALRDSL